ncbi:MAG: hypothetical protein JNL01_11675 [Bdellovibrionales bacterium]|nr:hypothetical protein [Bdellovibrionales bacterium]
MRLLPAEILKLYDAEFDRFKSSDYDSTRYEETPWGTRALGETSDAFSNFFELKSPTWSPKLIQDEIDYFRNLQREFIWKVRSDRDPAGLRKALIENGFLLHESGTLVVFDLSGGLPRAHESSTDLFVREVGVEAIPAMMKVQAEVWKDHFDNATFGKLLAERKSANPNDLRLFATYFRETMIACAWMKTTNESQFVHLNGGTTLPDFRKRGAYSLLVSARASLARDLGKRFLMIEAGPMSKPIAEKSGFIAVCDYWEFSRRCDAK